MSYTLPKAHYSQSKLTHQLGPINLSHSAENDLSKLDNSCKKLCWKRREPTGKDHRSELSTRFGTQMVAWIQREGGGNSGGNMAKTTTSVN